MRSLFLFVFNILIIILYVLGFIEEILGIEYVKPGGHILLNCSSKETGRVAWRRNQDVYAIGQNINPQFADGDRISVVGDESKGKFKLKITNFTAADQGIYWCVSNTGSNVIDYKFDIRIMEPPSGLLILNQDHYKIYAEEGVFMNLTCKVNSGIPPEKLSWYKNDDVLIEGSGEVVYNFMPAVSDHLQIFMCKAQHESLAKDLEISVQVILSRKPAIKLTSDPFGPVSIGQDVTLLCKVDNPFDLTNIMWTKDTKLLQYRSTEIILINVTINDAGTYVCIVENKFGQSSTSFLLEVQGFTSDKSLDRSTIHIRTTSHSLNESTDAPFMHKAKSFNRRIVFYGLAVFISIPLLCVSVSLSVYFKCCKLKMCQQRQTFDVNNTTNDNHESSSSEDASYQQIDEENMINPQNIVSNVYFEPKASSSSEQSSSSGETSSSKSVEPSTDIDGYFNAYISLDGETKGAESYAMCCTEQTNVKKSNSE